MDGLPVWAQVLGGKRAVGTGASRGLGAAIAVALADAGAEVVAVSRSGVALDAPRVTAWAADVADPAFHAALAERDIDILVNNAGKNRPNPIADMPVADFDAMLDLNVRAVFLCAQAAVRAMQRHRRGGAIVNMSSQMGHVGSPGRTAHCLTKHALE